MNHLVEREVVKFVLNGRTFDTASSSQVAVSRGVFTPGLEGHQWDYPGAEQVRFEHILFRTAKGNFFLHDHTTVKYPKGKPIVTDEAEELSADVAVAWIANNDAAIIDATGLPLPDEA